MTLDPVHFDGIARIARRIAPAVDESDQQAFAEQVWAEFLDPLRDPAGRTVLDPLDELGRYEVEIDGIAAEDAPYPTQHGLDSGTINPSTFKNGVVLDVAHAAMAAVPSELDLHRERTIVTTVHTPDVGEISERTDLMDEGHASSRLLTAPNASPFEETVVHELALYLAESSHALEHADRVSDLFVLDGPIYPKGMLNWAEDPTLADLLRDEREPRDVIENYVQLVETFVDRDVPMLGVVKNATSRAITRTVGEVVERDDPPWVNDTAFFTRLLERVELSETVDRNGDRQTVRERDTEDLTFTNWFRSRGGADRLLSADGDALGIDRELEPEAYEVTFFVVYDPRDDLCYRVEAPYAFTRDSDRRDRLRRQVLRDLAAERGPPLAVQKADELARIGVESKRSLKAEFERVLESDELTDYDDKRWDGPERRA